MDFDARVLAEASPGPGERIVVAAVDVSALRHERSTRQGHHMLAHLRTEAYPVYSRHRYPPRVAQTESGLSRGAERGEGGPASDELGGVQGSPPFNNSYEHNVDLIRRAKQELESDTMLLRGDDRVRR